MIFAHVHYESAALCIGPAANLARHFVVRIMGAKVAVDGGPTEHLVAGQAGEFPLTIFMHNLQSKKQGHIGIKKVTREPNSRESSEKKHPL